MITLPPLESLRVRNSDPLGTGGYGHEGMEKTFQGQWLISLLEQESKRKSRTVASTINTSKSSSRSAKNWALA